MLVETMLEHDVLPAVKAQLVAESPDARYPVIVSSASVSQTTKTPSPTSPEASLSLAYGLGCLWSALESFQRRFVFGARNGKPWPCLGSASLDLSG